ncbi:primosomal protein N' (replication factor Y) - superfamily II helicase [bacterium]|nr:primosomal protein N' (replication factor Y) - superfamily II helicase [bacterium]
MAEQRYPCASCGAQLLYAPGTPNMTCQYCGHSEEVPTSEAQIEELDFHAFLATHLPPSSNEPATVLHCNNCGAEFTWPANQESGACPFCGSNVVVPTDPQNRIEPRSVLPFAVDIKAAREKFKQWIGSRFWAPNNLKALALVENGLKGCYIPYWTYDCFATTAYTGMRGEHYYETESYTDSDGNRQTRQVQKTRWYPASGVVFDEFDDVLVLASEHLPPRYAQAMNSWNLTTLAPYDGKYLSGFVAMRYDKGLEQGFEDAKRIMDPTIRASICRDIGGDTQQITSYNTQHDRLTFKHILLPIWSGAYRYGGKSWAYLVNGQTGEIRGEAPVSPWKVAIAVVLGLLILGAIIFFTQSQ